MPGVSIILFVLYTFFYRSEFSIRVLGLGKPVVFYITGADNLLRIAYNFLTRRDN